MGSHTLIREWTQVKRETTRYEQLAKASRDLAHTHAKLVAEVLMIRTFLLLDNTIATAAAKLVRGTPYLDGTPSGQLVRARSIADAFQQIASYGRKKPLWNLKWTQEPVIRSNLQFTLASTDPFFSSLASFATDLEEMRVVRNHIAHGNADTGKKFGPIVVRYYGVSRRGVTPAVLLLSRRFGARPLLERYIMATRVFFKNLLRA